MTLSRPTVTGAILDPKNWAPEIARKLRAGEPLDDWERSFAAAALGIIAPPIKSSRGRKSKVPFVRRSSNPRAASDLLDKILYDWVVMSGLKVSRDKGGAFAHAARLFRATDEAGPDDVTPAMVEKAYQRVKLRHT
jgi:hypothetical protein